MSRDPYAHLKDLAWQELAEIDRRLELGQIDEAGWHAEIARLVVPAYLAADTPWGGSGKTGTSEDWDHARSLVAQAIDRDGSFLDVGCANGYLLETLPRWTAHRLERFGLDIAPELVAEARKRLPELAHRLFVGNALTWQPPERFTYVRTNLDYVPAQRRRELVEHLMASCERLIVGVYNEERHARPTESVLGQWGLTVAGRVDRPNRQHPEIDYRLVWIDR